MAATSTSTASKKDTASKRAGKLAEEMEARGAQAEESLREAGEKVSERSEELVREVADFVSRKPLASLGIAAAIGFILASLLRR